MKDQYVGDVSDYFKCALLRRVQDAGAEVVVCWMLNNADGNSDGRKRTYLNDRAESRPVDPEVFDVLTEIDLKGKHSVRAIEASGILRGATYIGEIVPDDPKLRYQYFWRVEEVAPGGQVVFVDPDNGLEIASKKRGDKDSGKFLYIDEFAQLARAGCSVIVYQHLGQRHMPREEFVKSQLERLADVRPSYEVFALVGPLAAALCAELPERGELADAAEDLATSWPGGTARVITRS